MRIALYEPDIAPNAGTIFRLAACLDLPVDVIEPCGFPLGAKSLRRAGMDYLNHADITAHASWTAFQEAQPKDTRLVLLTTKGDTAYTQFSFEANDVLLLGSESAGVPDHVHAAADARLFIPMRPALRSLNVAIACAMVVGEALRQTHQFPIL